MAWFNQILCISSIAERKKKHTKTQSNVGDPDKQSVFGISFDSAIARGWF